MILKCPNCQTSYNIDPAEISKGGRPIECFDCKCRWIQYPNNTVKVIEQLSEVKKTGNIIQNNTLDLIEKKKLAYEPEVNSLSEMAFHELENLYSEKNAVIYDATHQRMQDISNRLSPPDHDTVNKENSPAAMPLEPLKSQNRRFNYTLAGFALVSIVIWFCTFIYNYPTQVLKFNEYWDPIIALYIEIIDQLLSELKLGVSFLINRIVYY